MNGGEGGVGGGFGGTGGGGMQDFAVEQPWSRRHWLMQPPAAVAPWAKALSQLRVLRTVLLEMGHVSFDPHWEKKLPFRCLWRVAWCVCALRRGAGVQDGRAAGRRRGGKRQPSAACWTGCGRKDVAHGGWKQ